MAEVVTCVSIRLKPLRHVSGTVTNATGGPVRNATVTILEDGTELAAARTGEDGKFTFDVRRGSYELRARALATFWRKIERLTSFVPGAGVSGNCDAVQNSRPNIFES